MGLHLWRDVLIMFLQGLWLQGPVRSISLLLPTPSWQASTFWPCPGLKCLQRVPPTSVKGQGRREEGMREGARLSRSRYTLDRRQEL